MEPLSLPAFKWSPLQSNEIRILNLLPGKGEEQICFRLEHHNLDHLPSFRAISYCVGEDEPSNECVCEDDKGSGIVKITDNLWDALWQVRHEIGQSPLWVDQISIDQTNSLEKSQQIKLMSIIYSRATVVLVWLGKSDADAELAYNLLEDLVAQIVRLDEEMGPLGPSNPSKPQLTHYPLVLSSANAPEWIALRRLLERDWFTRLWVFQELVLARQALIICGVETIHSNQFFLAIDAVNRFDRSLLPHQYHLNRLSSIQLMHICHMSLSAGWRSVDNNPYLTRSDNIPILTLFSLMWDLMSHRTAKPHDKVYALLGLAQDIDPHSFIVDYAKPFFEVFAYVTRHFIHQYSDLTVLKLVSIEPRRNMPKEGPRSLPSWVPDYQSDDSETNDLRRYFGNKIVRNDVIRRGRDRYFNATGASKVAVVPENAYLLSCQAIAIGQILRLTEPPENLSGKVSICDDVLTGGVWSRVARECAVNGIYVPTGEPIELAYARTRIDDFLPTKSTDEGRRAMQAPSTCVPEPLPSSIDGEKDGRLYRQEGDFITFRILVATTGKRLFITDTGYMGIAQQSCIIGDMVYLLMGGDMPFILRKLNTGTHEFKGEAYVHGVMDGEYLLKRFRQNDEQEEMSDEEWLDRLGDEHLPFPTETVTLS